MIQAVILDVDVDGVIVGEKRGFNFPQPHEDVVSAFKKIREKGIPLVLCTGKFVYAIKDFVIAAHLDNPHIADGGAIIIDPVANKIIKSYPIEKAVMKDFIQTCVENNIYLELYTADNYYIQKNMVSDITTKHKAILEKEPIIVESLYDIAEKEDVIKIMPIAKDEEDMKRCSPFFEEFQQRLHIIWSIHPSALPLQFAIVTAPEVSKRDAVKDVTNYLGIDMNNILGVGDLVADWLFMQDCGYVGAMGNASDELKRSVTTKGEKGYIGKTVDEHGILDIFHYFGI